MEDEDISYKMLRKIQQREKNSPILSELKADFFDDLKIYLDNLKSRIKNEKSSQKKTLLDDEIENINKIIKNIYEQREKKIVLAAVSKARGGNPNLKNILNEEEGLFKPVLEKMIDSRRKILNFENKKEKNEEKSTNKAKETMDNELRKDNQILLVKEDIPEFIGTDEKKYNLKSDDIISVPKDMSEMLSNRGVVKKIKN